MGDVKPLIIEQKTAAKAAVSAIRKIIAPTADDLVRTFGDDAAKGVEAALSRAISKQGINIVEISGTLYLKSLRGGEIKVESVKKALDAVSQGLLPIESVLNTLPRNLADGSEFRSAFENLKPISTPVRAAVTTNIPSWIQSKWIVADTKTTIAKLFEKVNKVKNIKFDPNKITVTNRTGVHGRQVLEVKLPTGEEVLMYRSTGQGAPELKKLGEWQVINGFTVDPLNPGEIKWFVKDEATTQLTKGLNQYMTEFADFLKLNKDF